MATLYGRFHQVALEHPNAPALLGPSYRTSLSYQELDQLAVRLAGGLKRHGLSAGDRLAICSPNRPKWAATDLACSYLGVVTVPVHASLAPEAIGYILADAGVAIVACDVGAFPKIVASGWKSGEILLFDEAVSAESPVPVLAWDDLANQESEVPEAREESSLCTIIYTSGTTGNPKGVCLSDDNIASNVDAALQLVPLSSADRWCSLLPLSHALERTGGLYTPLLVGATVAFVRSPATLAEDLRHWKPTVLVSVPRVFERAYERILARANASPLRRRMLHWAMRASRAGGLLRSVANVLVWTRVRKAFGGRLRVAISGGASLNPHIAKFFRNIGLTIAEGYGLTETSPIATVNPTADVRLGTVGKAIPGVTISLTEEKEVIVQGPNVAMGYWVNGEVEPFREPGSFFTGDLGHLDSDGYLTIVGRAKEIIVLPNGKKINPVAIEQRIELSPGVEQAFVYLDPETKLIACLLVPSSRGLAELASIAGIATVPFETEEFLKRMAGNPEARALVERDLKSHEEHLPEYERVKQWQFTWPAFTEERQELTPTLKLRRFNILKRIGE